MMIKFLAIRFLLISVLLVCLASCDIPLDDAMGADEGNDATIILSGCNKRVSDGYLFCRATEGVSPIETISLTVPEVDCDRESCVDYQLFRQDGSPGESGSIKRGDKEAIIALSKIVGHTTALKLEDDGEYLLGVRIRFKTNGEDHTSLARAFIRVNILRSGYLPLGCDQSSVAWKYEVFKDCEVQYTSKLRSAVCGSCQDGT